MCLFQFWFPWCVCPAVGLRGALRRKREAVELPSAKPRGPEDRWACCLPTQPLMERETIRRNRGSIWAVSLYCHKLLVYIGKQGVLRGTFCSCTNHIKGQIVICHSCTNHVKGQILICHSCTNHVKGQVVMLFIVTRVNGDHKLSMCMKSREPMKSFNKQLRPHPHLFCQAPS